MTKQELLDLRKKLEEAFAITVKGYGQLSLANISGLDLLSASNHIANTVAELDKKIGELTND